MGGPGLLCKQHSHMMAFALPLPDIHRILRLTQHILFIILLQIHHFLISVDLCSDSLMASQILQDSVSFLTLVEELLKAQDDDFLRGAGSLRPGGRIDVNNMGDNVWLEQFRCGFSLSS